MKAKIIVTVFIIITAAMVGLSFSTPVISQQPDLVATGIYAAAGIILSALLSVIIALFLRGAEVKEKGMEAAPAEQRPAVDGRIVQILSILQKKGRLIDFLQEDISEYEDGQIGAAVRNIHKGCREALSEYVHIEPVMQESEGDYVNVDKGFDPSAVRLTGNVVGAPPFRGVLRHSGWRVSGTNVPPLTGNQDESIIEPAEVEIT